MSLTFENSQNDEDVIKVAAKAVWWHLERDGELEIPALDELARWWRGQCLKDLRIAIEKRVLRLMDWCSRAVGKDSESQMSLFASPEPQLPTLLDPNQPYEITRKWAYAKRRGFEEPHPFGMLLAAWYDRWLEVPANQRDDPYFPAIGYTQREEMAVRVLASKVPGPSDIMAFPGFAPGEPDGPPNPTPSYPLLLWELAFRKLASARSRHAAFLAARIFVDVILDVPPEYWALSASHGVKLPAERFRDFLNRLYIAGKSGRISWSRSTQLPSMVAAFDLLEAPEMRVPWIDRDNQVGGLRRVVNPVDVPRTGYASDVVQFAIHLPPGVKEGPLVDRRILRLAGAHSALAWRLWLNLSDSWRKPGRLRIPRGATWLQVRDPSRYPVVSTTELAAWAYPATDQIFNRSTQIKRRQRAETALEWLCKVGAAEIVHDRGLRITPGRNWSGWPGGSR